MPDLPDPLDPPQQVWRREQDLLTEAYKARDAALDAQERLRAELAGWQRDYRDLFDLRADIEAERDTLRAVVATLQRREREALGICHWTRVPGLMSDQWAPLCEFPQGTRWDGAPTRHCPFCGRLVTVPEPAGA